MQYPKRFMYLYKQHLKRLPASEKVLSEKEWLIQILEKDLWNMKVTSARNYIGINSLRTAMKYYGIEKKKAGTKIVRHWLALGLNPKDELIKLIKKYGYYHKVPNFEELVPSSTSLINAGKELGIYVGNDGYIKLCGHTRLYTAEEIIKMKGLNRRKLQSLAQYSGKSFAYFLKGMVPEVEEIEISLLGYPLEEAMKLLPLPILKRRNDWRKWV